MRWPQSACSWLNGGGLRGADGRVGFDGHGDQAEHGCGRCDTNHRDSSIMTRLLLLFRYVIYIIRTSRPGQGRNCARTGERRARGPHTLGPTSSGLGSCEPCGRLAWYPAGTLSRSNSTSRWSNLIPPRGAPVHPTASWGVPQTDLSGDQRGASWNRAPQGTSAYDVDIAAGRMLLGFVNLGLVGCVYTMSLSKTPMSRNGFGHSRAKQARTRWQSLMRTTVALGRPHRLSPASWSRTGHGGVPGTLAFR
jgi:hypothetical protein